MYKDVTHTWNPIKGRCPHKCCYCYMIRFWNMWGVRKAGSDKLRLDEESLKDNLGSQNTIFVGSSTDMFAKEVSSEWILKVLNKCREHPSNTYLFQTKNPIRFCEFLDDFPNKTILGTTIETNRLGFNYKAPPVTKRQWHIQQEKFHVMITIEPIMDFDIDIFVNWIKDIEPRWVNIGADSGRNNLPEPNKEKIEALIKELKKFTEVKVKKNMDRILKGT